MKVVLDTNVVLSAIFWKGVPGKILDLWADNVFQIVLSEPIFFEYKRVANILQRKYDFDSAGPLLDIIAVKSIFVNPENTQHPKCDDPDDDMFLAAAVFAKAKFLVSGDKALLRVGAYKGGKVVSAQQFLAFF